VAGAFFVSVSIISGWVKLPRNAIVECWRGDLLFWGLTGFCRATGASGQDEETILRAFLLNFECLPITAAVADRAAVIRREERLKMPDAIILATAEVAGRKLVTRNVKDFPSGVRVPYKV
jgi:predicted nucleic acid-binding protein